MNGAPIKFIIKCSCCKWKELSTGTSDDLKHLSELPNNCPSCGKPRRFKCPQCSAVAKMLKTNK